MGRQPHELHGARAGAVGAGLARGADDDTVRLEVVLPGLLLKLWEPLKTVLLGRAKLLLEKK